MVFKKIFRSFGKGGQCCNESCVSGEHHLAHQLNQHHHHHATIFKLGESKTIDSLSVSVWVILLLAFTFIAERIFERLDHQLNKRNAATPQIIGKVKDELMLMGLISLVRSHPLALLKVESLLLVSQGHDLRRRVCGDRACQQITL